MTKYPINSIIIHKHCNLTYKIINYKYDLFGEYVILKNLYNKKTTWNKYGEITTFYIEILKEYKLKETT